MHGRLSSVIFDVHYSIDPVVHHVHSVLRMSTAHFSLEMVLVVAIYYLFCLAESSKDCSMMALLVVDVDVEHSIIVVQNLDPTMIGHYSVYCKEDLERNLLLKLIDDQCNHRSFLDLCQ